jgi:alpha-beta hydrolase superfamily lysophospholipase
MDIILIPGFWLDASSWDDIVPALRQEGHRVRALTLPGMESKDADRSEITLRDHVDAVVEAIDSAEPADGKVVLVGHSGGGAIAHAAADARNCGTGWPRITRPCGSSRRSATSATSTCPPATGRSSPSPENSAGRSWRAWRRRKK